MRTLIVTILALIGLCFLGTGITGMVISQSCCFGETCPAEYLCDAAELRLEQPGAAQGAVFVGAIMLGAAGLGLYAHRRGHH